MAVKGEFEEIKSFEDWYSETRVEPRTGALIAGGFTGCARRKTQKYEDFRMEMNARVGKYSKYEKQAAAEVVSEKPDLPNISSGESAGFIRRIARNVVQHTPNVYITNEFDDESIHGILALHILKTKIIGDDEYSNDMQQNLVTTARRAFALGFDCVVPSLQQNALGGWKIDYDTIHYRDVFPEPGCKDIRKATEVYVRRYLTRGEVFQLIRNDAPGWDVTALRALIQTKPISREFVDHENKKHNVNSDAYEIITWYSNSGEDFLTFDARSKNLLRIEKNKHPLKEHPVFFFVPEKDDQQPLGKSLLSLTFGRQEFQDLFLNGAMKLWWRNINPPIIGYGTVNAIPNLSPGKYTQISNPNAKVEAFEVNTNALMMFGTTSQQNAANMVQLLGAADQQMASQSTGGMMSQTPQGVDAQQRMVDITTNNYQKAMESFFSKYCSYALTIYFQELKNTKKITPSADARRELVNAGLPPESFNDKGEIEIDFSELATLYFVKTVPGSLVELEDEKQIRILNELFVPLSQAMPALAQTNDPQALKHASNAMRYIIQKQIELSGSAHSTEIKRLFSGDESDEHKSLEERTKVLEAALGGSHSELADSADLTASIVVRQQEQLALLTQTVSALAARLDPSLATSGAGAGSGSPAPTGPQPGSEAATSGAGGHSQASAPERVGVPA